MKRLLLCLFCVALLATACGREPIATRVSEEVGVTMYAPNHRVDLPPIAGQTLDGTRLSIADLRGSVVVLNSWASWCAPCNEEASALAAASHRFQPQGVRFAGLDVTDEDASARQYTARHAVPYASIVDAKGDKLASIPGVPPGALPNTLIIDRQGRIAVRFIGAVKEPILSEQIRAVLDEG